MRLLLEVQLEDGKEARSRHFQREVTRNYPGVPRVGEAIDFGQDVKVMVRRIEEVIYLQDGRVLVRSISSEPNHEPDPQVRTLLELGYRETTRR